jgi:hypothetical protein
VDLGMILSIYGEFIEGSTRGEFFFMVPVNRASIFEMIWKKSYPKINRLISGWRKYFALERRKQLRYPIAINVEFYVCDGVTNKPLTTKGTGRLVNISRKGARLQTNTVRIGFYHLVISSGLQEKIVLMFEFLPSAEGVLWTIKSRILWYNRISGEGGFKFEFGVEFCDISPTQQKCLESAIRSI